MYRCSCVSGVPVSLTKPVLSTRPALCGNEDIPVEIPNLDQITKAYISHSDGAGRPLWVRGGALQADVPSTDLWQDIEQAGENVHQQQHNQHEAVNVVPKSTRRHESRQHDKRAQCD